MSRWVYRCYQYYLSVNVNANLYEDVYSQRSKYEGVAK